MSANENIVERLRRRVAEAKKGGFHVRLEHLEDGQSGWCQLGSRRMIFIDLAQTAREQLAQLDDALDHFARHEREHSENQQQLAWGTPQAA